MRHALNLLRGAATLAVCTTQALAQLAGSLGPVGDFEIVPRWTSDEKLRPATDFKSIQGRLTGAAYDGNADAVLRAAEALTKSIFAFPEIQRRQTVTYTTTFSGYLPWMCGPKGDTLIVEWEVDGPLGRGTLFLQDEPCVSIYALRIGGEEITSRSGMNDLLGKLLGPDKPLTQALKRMAITVDAPPPAISACKARLTGSSLHGVADDDLRCLIGGSETYFTLTMGKLGTERSYPVPPFVPERFPPLTEQVKNWDTARLWSELGGSEERYRLLLTEIFRRDASEGDFLRALDPSGPPLGLLTRARDAMIALSQAGKAVSVAKYLEPALNAYENVGPAAEEAADHLFPSPRDACSPDIQDIAIRRLRGPFPRGPIAYLGRCSTSPDVLRTLERLPIPEKYSVDQELAIRSMRNRLKERP
jgi:hypothetical protein